MALDFTAPSAPAAAAKAPAHRSTPTPARRLLASFDQRIGVTDRMLFTERLALLLETGVSLHEALKGLRAQAAHPRVEAVLGSVCDAILEGAPLSKSLARHPEMFPLTYVNLVAAAEEGGFLPEVLAQLVEMDEKQQRLRSLMVSALSYPAFLTFFSVSTVVFVLVSVFPKFTDMFDRIRSELPLSTRLLMALSELLVVHWPWVIGALAALIAALHGWLRRPATRGVLDALKLRLPVVRELYVQIYLSQTLRVMSLSLANGVPLVEALHACQDLVRNLVFSRFIDALRIQVTEGRGIAAGFDEAAFIPPMVRQMVATGEETGNLAKVMARVADFYERELTKKIGVITRLAEPLMLLVMGAIVGVIVASLILPIFKLSRAVH